MSVMVLISAQAYAITPSPQMIEQFKNLPKSEQMRLAQQYGIDPAQFTGQSNNQSQQLNNPQIVNPRANTLEQNLQVQQQKNLDFAEDSAKQALKPYGYDLFAGEPSTFAPVTDVPVPSEYIIGPGDNIKVQLYGKDSQEYNLMVNRDGTIQFPNLGPISVAGLSFAELRKSLSTQISQQMIGVQSNITLGELRSIRIFVAGDAYKPGSYTVSSLSTVTQALFVAGGINDIGSLRNIQVKRNGKLVGRLDLYDLLMHGDAKGDIRLQSGDVVFIPSVGAQVSVDGEVRRPAIYELKKGDDMADVIAMAAGLKAGAYPKSSQIERFNRSGLKTVINLDLTAKNGKQQLAHAGDFVHIKSSSNQFENAITLVGAVVRPGKYQWFNGEKISDLLPSLWGDLAQSADLDYGLVVREINEFGDIEVLQFAPGKAIKNKDLVNDIVLKPHDKVIIFNFSDELQNRYELNKIVKNRVEKVTELNKELNASLADPSQQIQTQQGNAAKQTANDDSLVGSDLFEAGFSQLQTQQLKPLTSLAGIAIAGGKDNNTAKQTLIKGVVNKMLVNLFNDNDLIRVSGVMNRNELLYPIIVKLNNQGRAGKAVSIVAVTGKVRHPGIYPLAVGGKISDLVQAAGGLKEGAYTARAELTRTIVKQGNSDTKHFNVDLTQAMQNSASDNMSLHGRDILTVMTTPDWQENKTVEVRGEVKFPGIYNIRRGETLKDIIARAGGYTKYAYLPAAVFVRESIKEQEQIEIKNLADQMRRDIATRGISKDGQVVNYADAQLMLNDLGNMKAVGRLVVDLPALAMGVKQADLQLEDNDVLYVPSTKQTIAVMGEVQHPAFHRFKTGLTVEQYLTMSGGPRIRADDDRTYIIKANGSVEMPSHSFWFSNAEQLSPGDTIIVPLNTEYKDNMTWWTQVTQIIYNSAVALATINNL